MNIDKKALKGVVDEIEASRARQRGETEFQREALKRAVKVHQLDAKAVRIVLQRRAMGDTKRDEQDYYVHAYELALGGKKDALEALERGATIRQAAKAGGISTGAAAALAKGVQESSFVNSETGEITKTALDTPGESAGTTEITGGPGSALATPAHEMGAEHARNSDAAPEGCVDGPSVLAPAEAIVPPCTTPQADEVAALPVTPVPDEGVGAGTIPTREGEREGDGLDIPSFLRRAVG